jgi:hypothetical protein
MVKKNNQNILKLNSFKKTTTTNQWYFYSKIRECVTKVEIEILSSKEQ